MKFFTAFALLTVFCSSLLAADIEPALQDSLPKVAPDQNISVIFRLYSPRDIRALDLDLHQRGALLAERHRKIIEALQANAQETQPRVTARLDAWKGSGKVAGYTTYWIENLIVVYAVPSVIQELVNDPAMDAVGLNFTAELIEPVHSGQHQRSHPGHLDSELTTPGQNATGATRVNRELGFTGQGVLVGEIDTGVDGTHPALASRWRGNFAPWYHCWMDFTAPHSQVPVEGSNPSHGTHTMGTLCGREIRANGDTVTVGAAPRAERWIEANAISMGTGTAFDNAILTSFQWLADPDSNLQTMDDVPDVIQNSWGVFEGISGYTQCFSTWNTVILNCEAAGPVITWSAGNEGRTGAHSLRAPASFELNAYQIFSVGAVDATDFSAPYPIADFSSRGPSNCAPNPNAIKPEICAPGVEVYSSVAGGGYDQFQWDGTSMAGPHVAGIVALMREACPNCDYITIKQTLMNTAIDYGAAGEDNTYGYGFIDGYNAVLAVASMAYVDGIVTTSGGTPLSDVTVQALGRTAAVQTRTNGYYILPVPAGTYDVRFTKYGYATVTQNNVVLVQGDTTHVNVTMNTVPSSYLLGTVVLQSGFPVDSARVLLHGTPFDTLIANENGQFGLLLPATDYAVNIRFTMHSRPPRTVAYDTTMTVLVGDTTRATLSVYVPEAEPTTADNYGYRAYDKQDRGWPGLSPQWNDLDPFVEGPGEEFFFAGSDSSVFLPAPFPLRFYGTTAETLTVNNNGWVLPGVHGDLGIVNTHIPQNLPEQPDPPGIIAPYWNDLMFGLGEQQFRWFDAQNGRWILQFQNLHPPIPNQRYLTTWQVQFLDPAFYPTASGDNEIQFLYSRLEFEGGCTMGIESPDEQTGIELLYNGQRNATLWPSENGSAVCFSTGQPAMTGLAVGVIDFYPPNEEPCAIRVGGALAVVAPNGSFTADSVAIGQHVSAMLLVDSYENARTDSLIVREPPAEATQVHLQTWRIDAPHDLYAWQRDGVIHLSWYRPASVQYHASPFVRYEVYRNGQLVAANLTDTSVVDGPFGNQETEAYVVLARYRFGKSVSSPSYSVTVDLAADGASASLPRVFALYPNYPNPFNPETRIRLDVPRAVPAVLQIFDVTGRMVRTLQAGIIQPGRHEFVWDSRDEHGAPVATGMYLCRFASHDFTSVQKMLLMR